jgi:hypothetical protein
MLTMASVVCDTPLCQNTNTSTTIKQVTYQWTTNNSVIVLHKCQLHCNHICSYASCWFSSFNAAECWRVTRKVVLEQKQLCSAVLEHNVWNMKLLYKYYLLTYCSSVLRGLLTESVVNSEYLCVINPILNRTLTKQSINVTILKFSLFFFCMKTGFYLRHLTSKM